MAVRGSFAFIAAVALVLVLLLAALRGESPSMRALSLESMLPRMISAYPHHLLAAQIMSQIKRLNLSSFTTTGGSNATAAQRYKHRSYRPLVLRRSKTRSPHTSPSITAPIGSATQSMLVTSTRSVLRSRTPPPTVTLSSTPSLELAPSSTITLIPPPCSATVVALPAVAQRASYSMFAAAPPSLYDRTFEYYEISSLVLAASGMSVFVSLNKGIVNPAEMSNPSSGGGVFRMSVKNSLRFPWLVSNAITVPNTADYDSTQKHGVVYLLSRDYGKMSVSLLMSSIVVSLESFSTYRITQDEWLYLSFNPDSTIPAMCATSPGGNAIVIRIVAPTLSSVEKATQVFCIVALVAGLVATASGSAVLTSHHSGMISVVASMQFAQEDGNPIGYAAYPFQVAVGTNKYQYVLGALFFNTAFPLLVFVVQIVVLRLMKSTGQLWNVAAGSIHFPRISYSVLLHFSPGIFFACGRTLGMEQGYVAAAVVAMIGTIVALWVGNIRHIVSGMEARFFPSSPSDDGGDGSLTEPRTWWTLLIASLSVQRGAWISTDLTGTFLERNGYMLERYSKEGRWFQGVEAVDFFLTGLLTVIDNYTAFLADYQFGCTLLIKLVCFVFIIARKPARQRVGGILLLAVYACQIVALCTLVVGGLRPAITLSARIGQDAACLVASLILVVDVVQTAMLAVHEKRVAAAKGLELSELKLGWRFGGGEDGEELAEISREGMLQRSQRRMLGWREGLVEGYLPGSVFGQQALARDRTFYLEKPPRYIHEILDEEQQSIQKKRTRRENVVAAAPAGNADDEGDTRGDAASLHSGSAVASAQAVASNEGGTSSKSPTPSVTSTGMGSGANTASSAGGVTIIGASSSAAFSRRRRSKYMTDGDSDDSAYDSDGLPILSHPRNLARERGEKVVMRRRRVSLAEAAAAPSSSETDSDVELVSEATAGNPHFTAMTKSHKRQYLAALKQQKSEIEAVLAKQTASSIMGVKEARQNFWESIAASR